MCVRQLQVLQASQEVRAEVMETQSCVQMADVHILQMLQYQQQHVRRHICKAHHDSSRATVPHAVYSALVVLTLSLTHLLTQKSILKARSVPLSKPHTPTL
jgi:hypothetical protein